MFLLNRCLKWTFLTGLNISFSLWLGIVYYQAIRESIPSWLSACVYLMFTIQVSYSSCFHAFILAIPSETIVQLYNIVVLTATQYFISIVITIYYGLSHSFFNGVGQVLFVVSVSSPTLHILRFMHESGYKAPKIRPLTSVTIVANVCDCVSESESRCEKCPCSICYNVLSSGTVGKTGCEHYFHMECLKDWMSHSMYPSCPTCRAVIG